VLRNSSNYIRLALSCVFIVVMFSLAYAEQLTRAKAIKIALKSQKISIDNVSLVVPFQKDSLRLSIIDKYLDNPLKAAEISDSIINSLDTNDIYQLVSSSAFLLDLAANIPVMGETKEVYPWKENVNLPPKLKMALDVLMTSFVDARNNMTLAFSDLDSFQIDSILKNSLKFLAPDHRRIDNQVNIATALEKDIRDIEEETADNRFFELAGKVKMPKILAAALSISKATTNSIELVKAVKAISGTTTVPSNMAYGDIVYYAETEFGPIIIGGIGPTVYLGNFAIIIDFGGDDNYFGTAGGTDTLNEFSILIDIEGNDLYWSGSHFSIASGLGGIGIIYDGNGNDIYRVENYNLGCGFFGWGILWDSNGDDSYIGNTSVIGAGFMGCGIIVDENGFDKYQANLYSQGFGFVKGLGVLIDINGNDSYMCTGSIIEKTNYYNHYLSLSQGYGFGYRPDYPGGVGILADFKGNDFYTADIFAQGGANWLSVGILYDSEGNDVYNAYQYAQGSALHLASGVLIDQFGDDVYMSHGTSQGCGDDLSIGYLNDRAGDDNYVVWDLSQGSGNANGIGVLIDEGNGSDNYTNKDNFDIRGFGTWRKEFGSIGIFLDLGGIDSYNGKGKDNSFWIFSTYGIGIDFQENHGLKSSQ